MRDPDLAIIRALRRNPRASITTLARVTNMARGTVQTRLGRLHERGVIIGHGPDLDPAMVGFPVTAFTTLSIVQGSHDELVDRLRSIPEVVEVHVVTGSGDLLVRLAARSNDDLHALLQEIVSMGEVGRADSQLALSTPVRRTLADVLGE
ncbi:MAG: Lrp/AsnC family transcriptional regulator [Acidimicrobiales bacterium]